MKTIKRVIDYIKQWNVWRKKNTNSKFYKFMVLTKFVGSPSFEAHKNFMDWGNVENIFESKEMEQ